MFNERNLVIATKHHKEKVIAPLLEKQLGVKCFVIDDFDSDQFGTFTGEIRRKNDALTTLRQKCLQAMEMSNCDLGVASEGSFGPHPSIFIANADDELVLLIDKKNNLEIVVRELSLETNFNATTANCYNELVEFAKKIEFPSHALILKIGEKETGYFLKGIQSWELLEKSAKRLFENNSQIVAETDMRALYNPTRMKVIEKATLKLVEKSKV